MHERKYRNKEWLKKQFDEHKTPNAVAEATGYPRTCITRYAIKYDIYSVKFNRDKTNHVNQYYFADIDTPEKAYFLGFIMADGNMYQKGNGKYQFSIKIKETDKDILYKFADHIDFPKDKIIIRDERRNDSLTRCAEIKIYNQEFCKHLINLGVIPRKTGKEKMPAMPLDLQKDFIRGYIDGDGWISKEKYQIGVCTASKNLIDSIVDYIYLQLGISINIHKDNVYTIRTYKRKTVYQMLKHFYYEDCLSLDRKYKLAIIKKQEVLEDLIGSL